VKVVPTTTKAPFTKDGKGKCKEERKYKKEPSLANVRTESSYLRGVKMDIPQSPINIKERRKMSE
jgi:hypothetical protein